MAAMLLRKFSYACLSLLLLVSLTFVLMKTLPGDPFNQEQALPKEIYEGLRSHYGLNDSLPVQFGRYLSQLVTFDFGPSLVYKGRSVRQIIATAFPTSAILGAEALLIAIPLGLFAGIFAGMHRNRWQDAIIIVAAVIGISVPSFILATFLQYLFGIKMHLLPIARWGSFAHTILPALSLAALPAAFIARMTRIKMIDEMHQGYITTARAKGLPEWRVILIHALKNILAPILSYLGPLTANILTGSFIIEKIYGIPGLGYWFVSSVLNRDYPLIMGITIFYCALLLLAAFIVDVACIYLDPRLAQQSKSKEGSA